MLITDDVFWKKEKSSNSSPSLDKDWSPTKKNIDFYLGDDLIIVIVMTQQGIR